MLQDPYFGELKEFWAGVARCSYNDFGILSSSEGVFVINMGCRFCASKGGSVYRQLSSREWTKSAHLLGPHQTANPFLDPLHSSWVPSGVVGQSQETPWAFAFAPMFRVPVLHGIWHRCTAVVLEFVGAAIEKRWFFVSAVEKLNQETMSPLQISSNTSAAWTFQNLQCCWVTRDQSGRLCR